MVSCINAGIVYFRKVWNSKQSNVARVFTIEEALKHYKIGELVKNSPRLLLVELTDCIVRYCLARHKSALSGKAKVDDMANYQHLRIFLRMMRG